YSTSGDPVDYRILDVNPAFERILGLKREDVVGKISKEAYGVKTPPYFDIYSQVTETGQSEEFESFFAPMKKHFHILAYSQDQGKFATTFEDITERKQGEEKMRNTLQRFYQILSNMQSGVLLVTNENRVEFVNQTFCDLFSLNDSPADLTGLSSKELTEKVRHSYIDPDNFIARTWEIVRLGKPVFGEDVKIQSGKVLLRDFAPLYLGGKAFGRLWIHRDISGRKLAEEVLKQKNESLNALNRELAAIQQNLRNNLEELSQTEATLRLSEERLARSQEIAHLGSWELDLVNGQLSWSDEVYRIFGLHPQEFGATYEAFLEAVHPEDRLAVDAAYSGSLREGRDSYEIEHRVTRKDSGEIRYVHEKCEHVRDDNGKIIRSVGMVQDITERKVAEQALRTERDFSTSILSTVGGLIIVLDREGRIVRFNRSCETITGYSFEEVKGKQFWDLFILPEEMQGVKDTFAQLTSGMFPNEHENFWLAKDGTRRFIQWSNSAMTKADGSVEYVLGTGIDITERKKADEALREALSEKEVLLSEIHHRVKNNLTAFISLLSLDGSYEDTESGRTLRKDLQNRARSMALIHETLYRTGKFSNVDMSIYLKNLVDQIAQSYGVRSDIKIFVDVDGTLSIDRATTAGLIINELVTNSFKYAFPPEFDCMALRGEPCTIRVSLAKEERKDVLRVSDNGCGFHEGFDPLKSKSLGLKLVNFLSRHQLRAETEVRTEKGTEFIFRLNDTNTIA
ncbi:MAG: PAS domain S-box protein, partial [Methanoregula sp.]